MELNNGDSLIKIILLREPALPKKHDISTSLQMRFKNYCWDVIIVSIKLSFPENGKIPPLPMHAIKVVQRSTKIVSQLMHLKQVLSISSIESSKVSGPKKSITH